MGLISVRWTSAFFATACSAALLAGCMMDAPPADRLPPDGADLPILRQWSRAHSHEPRALRLAIRDEAALSQVPLGDFEVDFSREMALIVALGRVPSDQYHVRIDRVHRDRGRLIADVVVVDPPRDAPLMISSPYCIAIVQRCDLPVDGFATRPPPRRRTWSQSELLKPE